MIARLSWLIAASAFAAAGANAQMSPPVPRPAPANCTAPEHRQLDFWVGRWDVYTSGTEELVARSEIENLYGGCAIRENWRPFDMNAGGSLSNYVREEGVWRQTWVDSQNVRMEFTGRLEDGKMVLVAPRRGNASEPRLTRISQWPQPDGTIRQTGEASVDGGATWTPTFDYTYKRARAEP